MTSTNRILNRLVLLVAALVLLAAGALLIATGASQVAAAPAWLADWSGGASEVWTDAAEWTVDIAGVGAIAVWLLIAAVTGLVLVVLLLVFVFTRGRGRSASVLDVETPHGRTTVDRSIADAVLGESLMRRPDVVSARADAYRVRSARAIALAVRVQPGASLARVIAATETAVEEWDRLLGTRVPVVLHLSDRSWKDALRPRTRVR